MGQPILAVAVPRMRSLGHAARRLSTSSTAPVERQVLERLLAAARQREAERTGQLRRAPAASSSRTPFLLQTYDGIDARTVKRQLAATASFDYEVSSAPNAEPHVILLRDEHRLMEDEVPLSVRAVARCGDDAPNVPVPAMTRRGIPVFCTPGAAANAQKEATLCGLLLASRGVVEGIAHVRREMGGEADHASRAARIERDKARFVGHEIAGKTLALCGLGRVGGLVAEAALQLGMRVVGYDPSLSVDGAWRLPTAVRRAASLPEAVGGADFLSLHEPCVAQTITHAVPAAVTETVLSAMRPTCHLLNFSRAVVDARALRARYDHGLHVGRYLRCAAPRHAHAAPRP